MRTSILIFALCITSGVGIAAPSEKKTATKEGSLVEHRFDLKGCPFTLKDKPGYTLITENTNNVVYSVIDDRRTAGGISITFRCENKPATEFCPDYTKAVDDGESNKQFLKDIRVVRYERINDVYYGLATAVNSSGVPRPRDRNLRWCLGDLHRSLSGYSIVGDEKHEYTDRILRILRTIRFIEPENPTPATSPDGATGIGKP